VSCTSTTTPLRGHGFAFSLLIVNRASPSFSANMNIVLIWTCCTASGRPNYWGASQQGGAGLLRTGGLFPASVPGARGVIASTRFNCGELHQAASDAFHCTCR
jgi:hypothetical protein